MKPFFDRDGITIYHGDCLEVLPLLGPAIADMALVDPPYGETKFAWDRPVDNWRPLVATALRPTGSLWCFGSFRLFFERSDDWRGWQYVQDLVWEKHNGSNSRADRFRRVHELLVQFIPAGQSWAQTFGAPVHSMDAVARSVRRQAQPPHWGAIGGHRFEAIDGGPRLMRSVLRVRSCHGYAVHPTQKPVGVLDPVIRFSCPPGGLVLDPMMGAGSTLLGARAAGRRAIGIEREARYCELAIEALSQGVLPFEGADQVERMVSA